MSIQMDALNSHRSKSYYACVGESTRAYQSPSKDLTAINNHLNRYDFSFNSFFVQKFNTEMIGPPLGLEY